MNQLVIITGATRGLGFALTRRCLAEGTHVVAIGRKVENLKPLQEEFGPALRMIKANFDTLDGIRAAGTDLQNQIKGEQVNYLVNNAGIVTPIGPITDIDLTDFSRLMNINVFAAFHLTNTLMPQFVEGARVLCITSRSAEVHTPGNGIYCISKAALSSLSGSYQVELAKINVSTCIPGEVDTDMQEVLRSGPQPDSTNTDIVIVRKFFDPQFFIENKKHLIPAVTSARFLYWLLTGPDSEEFEAKQPWTIYDKDVQSRWLEEGESFPYESP